VGFALPMQQIRPRKRIRLGFFLNGTLLRALGTVQELASDQPEHAGAVILSEGTMVLKPYTSMDYLDTHGAPRTLFALLSHRLCENTEFPKTGDWKIWADIIGQAPNVCFQTNSSLALGQATLKGVGISLQPIDLQSKEPTHNIGFGWVCTFFAVFSDLSDASARHSPDSGVDRLY
jgi:hypothetical protein